MNPEKILDHFFQHLITITKNWGNEKVNIGSERKIEGESNGGGPNAMG